MESGERLAQQQETDSDAQPGDACSQGIAVKSMRDSNAQDYAPHLAECDGSCDHEVDRSELKAAQRARYRRNDLEDLAGADGCERGKAERDHQRHGQHRTAYSGKSRSEARNRPDSDQERLLGTTACFEHRASCTTPACKRVGSRKDDQEGKESPEYPRSAQRVDPAADEAHERRAQAGKGSDPPVDTSTAMEHPAAGNAGEDEREKGGRHRFVNAEPRKDDKRGDEKDAADAGGAYQDANAKRCEQ